MRENNHFIKSVLIVLLFLLFANLSRAQSNISNGIKADSLYNGEISCGTCMFKMKGNGCKLAVKINEQFYFVEGAGIDDFGDAHANDGFCNAIKKATMTGTISNNIFIAKEIVPEKPQ